MSNRYQELVQKAWESGEYQASPDAPSSEKGPSGDAKALRSFIRSKMEWIAEREAYDVTQQGPRREARTMKLAQYVKFREEKFGGVLFETRSEKVFTLSPTGAAVVKEIVAGGDEAAVLGRLKARYQGETLEGDAKEFIASLKTKGLLAE